MKKILVIMLAVIMSISIMFSGCSLWERNTAKYMDTVVATVEYEDLKIEITKQELLRYYSNYYDTYVNKNGYTPEKAAELCLDLVINQKLLVDDIKNNRSHSHSSSYSLTQNDKNAITLSVFEYVESQLSDYVSAIKIERGITSNDESEDVDEETFATKQIFEPTYQAIYNDDTNQWEIKYVLDDAVEVQNPALSNIYASYFWQESEKDVAGFTTLGAIKSKITQYSDGIREEAMKRFVKDLKNNESYRNYSDNSSYDIFMREYNRVYKIYEDNKYIEKLEDWFKSQLQISANDVLDFMKYKLNSQKELYDDENGIYSAYDEAMKSNYSDIYYHPTNSWFSVAHILIGYSDAQKDQISAWKEDFENGTITELEYKANLESMKSQIVGQARDSEGKLVGDVLSATEIYNEISNALAQLGNDADKRINAFDDFIYKYSTDTGSFNSDMYYVIPLDSTYDTMVAEFASASRELYNNGVVGAISGMVLTEYGVHIIIYAGSKSNVVEDINSLTIQDLLNAKLRASSDKTMFDIACEGVEASTFSTYQENLIQKIRENKTIKIYKGRFSDIYA